MCSSRCVHEVLEHSSTLVLEQILIHLLVPPCCVSPHVQRITSENLQNIRRKTWDVRPGVLGGCRIIETEKECV